MRVDLANFHFLRPAWLLLVPVAITVWWFWQRRVDPLRGWREQVDPDLLKALTVDDAPSHVGRAGWLLAGWLLATVGCSFMPWSRKVLAVHSAA